MLIRLIYLPQSWRIVASCKRSLCLLPSPWSFFVLSKIGIAKDSRVLARDLLPPYLWEIDEAHARISASKSCVIGIYFFFSASVISKLVELHTRHSAHRPPSNCFPCKENWANLAYMPRYAFRTSGFASSSFPVPVNVTRPVSRT